MTAARLSPETHGTAASNPKVALVTGAATRVGRAIAEELANAGMALAIHYRTSETQAIELRDDLRRRGRPAECFGADLEHRDEARHLVARVLDTFGRLDLLVPSAALFERVAVEDVTDAHWDRMLEVNLTSAVVLVRQSVRALREHQGNVVFITCSSVESPYRFHLPYVVSKAGLHQAMRALALELAPKIRVNAVAPGTVLPPENMDARELEILKRRVPLQRFGRPEDIARTVRFLSESDFITGQQIVVDGGRALGRIPDGS